MTAIRGAVKRIPLLDLVVVAGASLVILVVLNPWLILSPTTPTGGDTGAHVLGPAYLRDVLLPQGRILGWSNAWFAGFPIYYFYFPLPSLVIVALDTVLPYGVAFKLVTVMGLLALPPALCFLASAMRLGRSVAMVVSGAAVVFAFSESFTIYGGNVASTLAGEFSYSWSFALALVYLGLLIKAVRDDKKYVKWAALALAATALSHVLTTLVVVLASLVVLTWKKGLGRTLIVWGWGLAIAGFWAVPLLARIGLTSDMAWTPLTNIKEVFPVEIWILLPVAIGGAVWAMRRTSRPAPLIAATVLPLAYYPLPTLLPELFPAVFEGARWKLWNGRLLPYWYFGVAFFAAVGLGAAVVWLSRRLPTRVSTHLARLAVLIAITVAVGLVVNSNDLPAWTWVAVAGLGLSAISATLLLPPSIDTRNFLVGAATALLVLGAASSVTFVDGWARWNYEGYEAKESFPEYQALMVELDQLPPGRVMWESNSELNKYGTPMAPMLIPYWTEGKQASMEGLFFESSLTTPFHFINHSEMSYRSSNPIPGLKYYNFDMERGIKHMGVYGVDYYVSFTPEAKEKAEGIPELEKLADADPFAIFKLPDTQLVEPARYLPAVYEVPERSILGALTGSTSAVGSDGEPLPGFHDMALEWYDDIDNLDRLVVADGPEEWPRIQSIDERPNVPLDVPDNAVTDIVVEDHRLSFRTEAVGLPHIVKISYFPNWTAVGAEGPWRATPSLMVVVPTQNEVVLEFRDTWAETVGKGMTLLGLLALVGAAVSPWWRTRRRASGEPV